MRKLIAILALVWMGIMQYNLVLLAKVSKAHTEALIVLLEAEIQRQGVAPAPQSGGDRLVMLP